MHWNYWDRLALVYFHMTPGLGQQYLRRIEVWCTKHGVSPRKAWHKPEILAPTLGPELTSIVLTHQATFSTSAFRQKLARCKITLLWDWETEYPTLLRQIPDYPFLLYCRGNRQLLARSTVGVVGSRKMTGYGRRATYIVVKDLVAAGFVIVSGFMYGVDVCAHQAAMQAGGGTIAVLGFGQFEMWPKNQVKLLEQLLDQGGLVLSEFAPDVPANPGNFIQRNRIVAGLSRMVIVTEAGIKSGSHTTAHMALDYGRSVGAVPGPFDNIYSQGTKLLLNEGAALITSGQDVLAELGITSVQANLSTNPTQIDPIRPALDEIQTSILDALQKGETTLDQLVLATQCEAGTLLSVLSELELAGYICNKGEYYQVLD